MCSYCLVGGLCCANTQFIGHKIVEIWVESWRNLKSYCKQLRSWVKLCKTANWGTDVIPLFFLLLLGGFFLGLCSLHQPPPIARNYLVSGDVVIDSQKHTCCCCCCWSIRKPAPHLNCVFVVFFTFSFRVGFCFLLPHDAGRLVAGPDAFSSSWCWLIGCGCRCLHGCRSDTFMLAVTFRISSHWER